MVRRPSAFVLVLALMVGGMAILSAASQGHAPVPGVRSIKEPRVVEKDIPFGAKRKRETAAYSKRHYGTKTWHLDSPQVIVEHYTDSSSFDSAYNTFANDTKHLGELPGVCSHYVIDSDGTIYEVVPTGTICRHTIGLNWTAIGIEHVGTSDQQIMGNKRQMRASLKLTVWLMQEYGISVGNVIGHSESLTSPFYEEKVKSYRCQTHSDWLHKHMNAYRRRVERVAKRSDVPVGDPYKPVSNGC